MKTLLGKVLGGSCNELKGASKGSERFSNVLEGAYKKLGGSTEVITMEHWEKKLN
jgi:hypothetical protein